MKLIRAVLFSVCALLLLITTLCLISDVSTITPPVVYAEEGGDMSENQIMNGVMGIAGSVDSLRSYYEHVQTKKVEKPGEEVLVGTRSVNSGVADRFALCREVSRAGELGYFALQTVAQNQMPYQDYYTLLQIVEAEATGGDLFSKMLVANVVLNRVEDSHFPDNIYDVVYQNVNGYPQFSPTADGRMYSVTITDVTMTAVRRVLEGEDNSRGALFFVARSSATSGNLEWFDESLVRLYEYGGHEYFTFREYVADQA